MYFNLNDVLSYYFLYKDIQCIIINHHIYRYFSCTSLCGLALYLKGEDLLDNLYYVMHNKIVFMLSSFIRI